jgi:hypothetical protein
MILSLDESRRRYVLETLGRYWSSGSDRLAHLPLKVVETTVPDRLPPRFIEVRLPEWANDLGPFLLVPERFRAAGEGPDWRNIDWLGTAFWYLHGSAERAHEAAHGPIHSYSFRLGGWDSRMWERAWVNRIALFLRRWSAHEKQADETQWLGPLPEPEIVVTHDVDAVRKTPAIRIKQSVFHLFNAGRSLVGGYLRQAWDRFVQALRFFFGSGGYWNFDTITQIERHAGIRSCFNWYGGAGGMRRPPRDLLFDPSYDVMQPQIASKLRELRSAGWMIGLHQSFAAWDDAARMQQERARLEAALGASVTSCRQHWLRFSWARTWKAQQQAGLELDTTLGFNDRPGFRVAAALRYRPWDSDIAGPLGVEVLPMVLMDSHLYDYQPLDESGRNAQMRRWIEEIKAVRGQASVIWHTHVLSSDYGWRSGFEYLIKLVAIRHSVYGN